MNSRRVITTDVRGAENVWKFENQWTHGLCDCCSDCKKCCFVYCCFPCFLCMLFRRTGDCLCTPMCVPSSLTTLRTKLRTGFRIDGSICNDCLCTSFCALCVGLQMAKELDSQGL